MLTDVSQSHDSGTKSHDSKRQLVKRNETKLTKGISATVTITMRAWAIPTTTVDLSTKAKH